MDYKLLLAYDVKPHKEEEYYRFVMGEFLPRAQAIGLTMTEGWQTVYGHYPARLLTFAAAEEETFQQAIQSEEWDSIETKLGEFIINYEKRLVPAKAGFQFFIPSYRGAERG